MSSCRATNAEERNDEANRIHRALHAAAAERDEARADLAETRAQLERLREAALMLADRVRAEGGHGHRVHELSDRVLDALSIPGPTLAEIRRAAQVEVLRELAKEMAPPAAPTMGSATWDAWRERIARQFGTFDAVAVHDWLRQRADDLEAGRG